jgi:hypothetical protein
MKSTRALRSRTGSTMFEKSSEPPAASVSSGVKTKYDRGEMISGANLLGESRRERL